ncbi:hypothetical protein M404DRAFT_558639 [Pisolithus tinctorius Marx 270]|uniref:Uncharacterized protein n=1 Tax=Pisolithus tinctorius Marx 270 TaxID=870435 RepID=A0A0C3NTZ7_PISTI|nr:hypothetical protein M404DRAFT_558639 [Pisolithus tinctorius Marx 270]
MGTGQLLTHLCGDFRIRLIPGCRTTVTYRRGCPSEWSLRECIVAHSERALDVTTTEHAEPPPPDQKSATTTQPVQTASPSPTTHSPLRTSPSHSSLPHTTFHTRARVFSMLRGARDPRSRQTREAQDVGMRPYLAWRATGRIWKARVEA